ncbi:uncharacterized protein MYCFIDRAFT_170313 [Pseudocercospora fijiensis CIRAD86]|uniref:Uncharacterized protein n=1 Tax=Pseudocercospora fijiensis (strain CIRAD86) TaxID=383855 RepID=N1QBW3_PSEFD|nr:uncharacterized protein MYCFIDRAFT_170313 [Pseudocercospora fijiensis CIRAD86]EME88728.1 hypothetical protein MYCFIDRAFT_170313 [Pseudocercospora fijiensis CIRAD86]
MFKTAVYHNISHNLHLPMTFCSSRYPDTIDYSLIDTDRFPITPRITLDIKK